MAKITINGISIDPAVHHAALAATNLVSPTAAASNFILVQAKQPLTGPQREQLERMGAKILEYVPENTFICQYPPSNLTSIRALPFVEWANIYLEGFKVPTSLRPGGQMAPANLLSAPPLDLLSNDRVTVNVVLHKGVTGDSVRNKIAAAAGLNPAAMEVGRNKIRLTVERRRLKDIATTDEVRHIEPYVAPKLANNIARGILRANEAENAGGLAGEGQIVAIADTGLDTGTAGDVHPAFTGRVLKLYPLGRAGDASDPDGHGTHVAGSVLGDGVMTDGTVIQGTAPKARLVFQSVLDGNGGLGGLPADLHDLFTPPYRDDGARVHTNSWGAPTNGGYDANATEVDDFVWNNRDCVICFAAGNDGVDSQGRGVMDNGSVGSPGTAKNCITVGATENNRTDFPVPIAGDDRQLTWGIGWPNNFPADPINSDKVADNPDGMAAFSSRGPAVNNRVRPDVVAPGTSILSTRSRLATGAGWGLSPDPLFFYEGGTSMATPLVAGCAAVVRQYLIQQGIASPNAALVKAMLINGTKIIPGQYSPAEVGPPPDFSDGFGRVDLAATVGPYAAGETVVFKDEKTALDTGQEERTTQSINANGKTLKVTLVWTDPSGEALQNDLDLVVQAGGQEQHGNFPLGSPNFDRANNVEKVIWPNVPQGDASIIVRGFRITTPQSYALVVRVS